jgi:hypothetical protein
MNKKRYIETGGNECPFCGSLDIETDGQIQTDSGIAWQPIKCNKCDETWEDIYDLVYVKRR